MDTEILIIGAGIVGLTVAREISLRYPDSDVTIIEKEPELAAHASGRNSGVLHAGFYYTPDSLKARFTVEGNRLLTAYCLENGLSINRCGKVVVAKNEKELTMISELKKRGDANGVSLQVVDEKYLSEIEPNARTCGKAIFSPSTSTINPSEVVRHIAGNLGTNARLLLGERFVEKSGERSIRTNKRTISYSYLVNAAGLYADKIARHFGLGGRYTLIPFKGLYMAYNDQTLLRRHVYPVPDLRNPFLGVHFTITVDGKVKIGPTAVPAFWRENYKGLANFKVSEFVEVIAFEAGMFLRNSSNFRSLAFEEMRKNFGGHMLQQASILVKHMDVGKAGGFLKPGIRAQLLDKQTMSLVMDFVVERGERSTHILNAVSPAFTCSLSFAKFIVDELEKDL